MAEGNIIQQINLAIGGTPQRPDFGEFRDDLQLVITLPQHGCRRLDRSAQAAANHAIDMNIPKQLTHGMGLLDASSIETDRVRIRDNDAVGINIIHGAVAKQVQAATMRAIQGNASFSHNPSHPGWSR